MFKKRRLTLENIEEMIYKDINFNRRDLESKKIECENLQKEVFFAEQKVFKLETKIDALERINKSQENELKTTLEAYKKIEKGYLDKIKELQAEKTSTFDENSVLKEKNEKLKLEIADLKSDRYLKVELKDEKIPKSQKIKVKSGARTSKIIKDMKEGNE